MKKLVSQKIDSNKTRKVKRLKTPAAAFYFEISKLVVIAGLADADAGK